MGFFTDTTTCIGCKACEVACKQWNDLPADGSEFRKGGSYDHTGTLGATTWRHVRFVEIAEPIPRDSEELDLLAIASGGAQLERWVFMSDVCKHCTNAGCLDACPTGALIRTEFETVIVQPDVCNGCGYCVPACPFGVIDRDHDDGRAAKCTLCYDRLEDGLEPACAKACPTDSIQFGEHEELVDRARAARGEAARARARGRVPLRRRGDDGRRPRRVLPAHRGAGALRPARGRRLADPAERRGRDGGGDGRRPRRRGGGGRRAFAMAKRGEKAPFVGVVAAVAAAADLAASLNRRRR